MRKATNNKTFDMSNEIMKNIGNRQKNIGNGEDNLVVSKK